MTTAGNKSPFFARWPLFWQNALLSLAAALFSIALQGFSFGLQNNYFHLPIVFSLPDDPSFKSDAYIQSLHFYASEFWLLARYLITPSNAPYIFLLFHVISRWIFMASMLACARLLGVIDPGSRLLFSALIALSPVVIGHSLAGGHGMLIGYFTHSEIANGVTLFCLYYLAGNRIAAACALNGLVFAINAFVGVWNAAPFALYLAWRVRREEIAPARVLRELAVGLLAFLVIAGPTLVWIVQAERAAAAAPAFDYIEYLRFYWPFHFLFTSNPVGQQLHLALLFACALMGFLSLGKTGSGWVLMLAGYAAVYAAGIFAPALTHSTALLNLHLLRSGALIQMLACLVMVSLAVNWMRGSGALERGWLGPLSAIAACTVSYLEPLFLLCLFFRRMDKQTPGGWLKQIAASKIARVLPVVAIVLILAATLRHGLINYRTWSAQGKVSTAWRSMADWARHDTPAGSVFLLPAATMIDEMKTDEPTWRFDSFPFEAFSRRQAWVTFREGAAVMWMPSFYPQWNQRILEVLALKTDKERIEYARTHHIDYLVVQSGSNETDGPGAATVYQNNLVRVLKIANTPGMEPPRP